MNDARRLLCSDLAFSAFVGCAAWAVGLLGLWKFNRPIYVPWDFVALGILAFGALVLWYLSLPPDEKNEVEETKTPGS